MVGVDWPSWLGRENKRYFLLLSRLMTGGHQRDRLNNPGGIGEHATFSPPPRNTPHNWQRWTGEEAVRVQHALGQPIEYEHIQFRPSAQGSVAYVEGWKALNLANEVFGFNGWSSEILSLNRDFEDISGADGGRISVGYSCMVRVRLRDGTFHDVCR